MKCDICNKELEEHKVCKALGKVLCAKHYQQMIKYGHVLDNNPKTTNDLNDIEITEDGIWIITYSRKCEVTGKCLIDNDEYAEEILKHKWRYWGGRYFTGNFKPITLSVFVMQLAGEDLNNKVVDHINNNPADNRKANLRACTQSCNTLNKLRVSTATNEFKGIHWNKTRQAYEIEIQLGDKRVHFTRQKKLEDALFIRYTAEQILFKEFRCTQYDSIIMPYIENCKRKDELKTYVITKLSQIYDIN